MPLVVVFVRRVGAVLSIVNRYSLASRTGGGNSYVKGLSIFATRLIGVDGDPATAHAQDCRGAADRQRRRPDCPWHLGIQRPLTIDQIKRNHSIEAKLKAHRNVLIDGESACNEMLRQRRRFPVLPRWFLFKGPTDDE